MARIDHLRHDDIAYLTQSQMHFDPAGDLLIRLL